MSNLVDYAKDELKRIGMILWKYRDKPFLKKQRKIQMCIDCNEAMKMFIKRYKGGR